MCEKYIVSRSSWVEITLNWQLLLFYSLLMQLYCGKGYLTDAMSKVDNDCKTTHKLTVIKVILSPVTQCRISGHTSIVHYIWCCTNTGLLAGLYFWSFQFLEMYSSFFHLCKGKANMRLCQYKGASQIRNKQFIVMNWWRLKARDKSLCSNFYLLPFRSSLQSVGGRASCFRDTPICPEIAEGFPYDTLMSSAGTFTPL